MLNLKSQHALFPLILEMTPRDECFSLRKLKSKVNTVQYKPRSEVQVQSCVPPWSREDPYKKKKKKVK